MRRAPGLAARRQALKLLARLAAGVLGTGAVAAQSLAPPKEGPPLPRIDDLRRLSAQMRRERVPALLFFSTAGCPYCIEVRRNYLAPRLKENAGDLLIREVEIVGKRMLIDRDGRRITEAEFAARFGVHMVPVVQLVDADLAPLGRPLVGIDAAGFYDGYLSAAIDEARKILLAR